MRMTPYRSSQVALLGISSIQSASGTSTWLILLLPLLFTAGMCLLDTTDGALMLALYTSATKSSQATSNQRSLNLSNPTDEEVGNNGVRVLESLEAQQPRLGPSNILPLLYTNIILTALTVLIALVIGALQILNLAGNILGSPSGKFWDGVGAIEDRYDIVGGAICGTFAVVGILSFWAYPRWRRWAAARAGISVNGTTSIKESKDKNCQEQEQKDEEIQAMRRREEV